LFIPIPFRKRCSERFIGNPRSTVIIKCYDVLGCEAWLISRNEDASKKIFVATGILSFDFELSIGDRVRRLPPASS
jgi:hypothetical protein